MMYMILQSRFKLIKIINHVYFFASPAFVVGNEYDEVNFDTQLPEAAPVSQITIYRAYI